MTIVSNKTIKYSAAILLFGVIFYILLLTYANNYNDYTEKLITNLIFQAEQYYNANGYYPEALVAIDNSKNSRSIKSHMFPMPTINYISTGNCYKIYYYKFPLGPYFGYSSKDKQWYFEE